MENNNYTSQYSVDRLFDGQLCEHTDLLKYCPDYEKEKAFLESVRTIPWEEIKTYVESNYVSSNIYELEGNENLRIGIPYNVLMKYDVLALARVRYAVLNELLEKCKNQAIEICNIIDYLINYPTRYPIPLEEEKNPELEALLEKYDMIIRYYLHDDIDGLQIDGDTIKRLVKTLYERDYDIKGIIVTMSDLDGYILFKQNKSGFYESASYMHSLVEFPLSYAQEQGRSLVDEGRYYQSSHVNDWNKAIGK